MKAMLEEVALVKDLTAEPRDPTATSRLFEQYYASLAEILTNRFSDVDVDTIREVVFNTLDTFISNTHRFDPERGRLESYLKMDAWRDLQNKLPKYRKSIKLKINVEDWDTQRNIIDESPTSGDEEQILALASNKLREIFPSNQDFELAKMVICEVRGTEKYVPVLGLEGQSSKEQQKAVKQHKDRVKKALDRQGWAEFRAKIVQRFL